MFNRRLVVIAAMQNILDVNVQMRTITDIHAGAKDSMAKITSITDCHPEWIEVNLPWKKRVEFDIPEYPSDIVDSRTRERFGLTKEELDDAFEKKHGKVFWQVKYGVESQEEELLMQNVESTHDWTDEQYEEFEAEKTKRVNDVTRNPVIAEVNEHIAKLKAINEFAQE